MWELAVGAGGGLSEGGQKEENWDNCNRRTIKKLKKSFRVFIYIAIIIMNVDVLYQEELFLPEVSENKTQKCACSILNVMIRHREDK